VTVEPALCAAFAERLSALGVVVVTPGSDEARHELGRALITALGEGTWIELSLADAPDGEAAFLALLGRLGLETSAREAGDSLLETLEARGLDLYLLDPGERHLAALTSLIDALGRGALPGPRLVISSALPLDAALVPLGSTGEVIGPGGQGSGELVGPQGMRIDTRIPPDLWPLDHALIKYLEAAAAPLSVDGLTRLVDAPRERIVSALARLVAAHRLEALPDGRHRAPQTSPSLPVEAGLRLLASTGSTSVSDQLVGLSALLRAGEVPTVVAFLGAHWEALLDPALKDDLRALLARSADPRLERWRLEHTLATAEVIEAPPPPLSQDPDTLGAYAEVLFLCGRLAEAAAVATASGRRTVRLARIEAIVGTILAQGPDDEERARQSLERLALDPADDLVRQAALALALSMSNHEDEALARIAAHWSALHQHPELPLLLRLHVIGDTLNALVTCERLDLARRYVAETEVAPLGTLGYTLALIALQSGELTRADALLARCEQGFDPLGVWHGRTRALRIRWALARGDLAGLEARIVALLRDAIRLGDRTLWGLGMTYLKAMGELGRPTPPLPEAPAFDALPARAGGWHALFSGERPVTGSRRQRAWQRILEAIASLRSGDASRAITACDEALVLSRATGFVLDEVAACRYRLDACLASGDDAGLRETLARLDRLGASRESPAIAVEVQFIEALRAPEVDLDTLLAIADAWDVSPIAARRARALLGVDEGLDAADRTVTSRLEHAKARPSTFAVSGDPKAPWRDTWLFDDRTRSLHRAGLPPVRLQTSPLLWTLLETLARSGEADKERLVMAGWGLPDYHPLRDDNRLQVAIRKLRGLLEDDPSAPVHLLTTGPGYALSGRLRLLRKLGFQEA
jgi:hypothetical protein